MMFKFKIGEWVVTRTSAGAVKGRFKERWAPFRPAYSVSVSVGDKDFDVTRTEGEMESLQSRRSGKIEQIIA